MTNRYKVYCYDRNKTKGIEIISSNHSFAAEYFLKLCLDCDETFRESFKQGDTVECEVIDLVSCKSWDVNFRMDLEPVPHYIFDIKKEAKNELL